MRSLASQARPRLTRGTTSVPEIDEETAPGSPSVPHASTGGDLVVHAALNGSHATDIWIREHAHIPQNKNRAPATNVGGRCPAYLASPRSTTVCRSDATPKLSGWGFYSSLPPIAGGRRGTLKKCTCLINAGTSGCQKQDVSNPTHRELTISPSLADRVFHTSRSAPILREAGGAKWSE